MHRVLIGESIETVAESGYPLVNRKLDLCEVGLLFRQSACGTSQCNSASSSLWVASFGAPRGSVALIVGQRANVSLSLCTTDLVVNSHFLWLPGAVSFGLITRRSEVRILPPLLLKRKGLACDAGPFLVGRFAPFVPYFVPYGRGRADTDAAGDLPRNR